MSGQELWKHIQDEAREAFDVDSTWTLTMVDLGKRDGQVIVRLDSGMVSASAMIWIEPALLI